LKAFFVAGTERITDFVLGQGLEGGVCLPHSTAKLVLPHFTGVSDADALLLNPAPGFADLIADGCFERLFNSGFGGTSSPRRKANSFWSVSAKGVLLWPLKMFSTEDRG